MKDSGVEWIGDIPEVWTTFRIKYNTYLKGRIGWQGLKSSEFIDEGPYLVTGTDFKNGRVNWNTAYHISMDRYNEAPEIQLKVGDLLITKDGTVGKLAFIDYLPDKASLNSHLVVVRPTTQKYSNKYLYWVLSSDVFTIYTELTQDGTIMASLSQEKLNNFSFPLPPSNKQNRIVSFLDTKCSLIDTTIEKEREVIDKLKEYRQAVITEAVTKGIRPGVPMKDSDVEWIGAIPEEWEVCKIKYLARMQSGDTISSEIINDDGEYPVYGGNGLRGYTSSFTHSGSYILIGRQGALCGNVHVVNGNFWPSEHAIVVYELGKSNQKWLAYILFSMNLNQYSTSAAQPGLAKEKIRDLFVCLPPFSEQQEIASFLDAKCSGIDATIQKRELAIEKLTQYKQSLIYECVTGKREVLT
ncbi:MAG: restriction endonuclease subunit S [Candidatus Methanomethylophilaceae archaeon]|jgi:type I restriction enzyme S subunit